MLLQELASVCTVVIQLAGVVAEMVEHNKVISQVGNLAIWGQLPRSHGITKTTKIMQDFSIFMWIIKCTAKLVGQRVWWDNPLEI